MRIRGSASDADRIYMTRRRPRECARCRLAHSIGQGRVQGLVGVRVRVEQSVDRQRFEYRQGGLRRATGRVSGRGAADGVLFLDELRAALSTEVLGEVGCDTIRVEWGGPVAVVTWTARNAWTR